MGIVIRQSIWGSLFSYTGVILGYLATLVLFPKYFSIEEIGLIRLIVSNAMMFLPLAVVGMNGTWIKIFPYLQETKDLRGKVLSYQLMIVLTTCFCIALVTTLLKDPLGGLFESKSPLYKDYLYVSLIILIAQALFEFFSSYSTTHLNIIVPNFLRETLLRIINILDILLFGFGLITFDGFIEILIINYALSTFIIVIYTVVKQGFRVNFNKLLRKAWRRKINKFSGFILTLGTGGSIISNVGFLITSIFLGLTENGILTTCIFIGLVIEMPKRIASQIITPFISTFLKHGDIEELRKTYSSTSVNLFLIGSLIGIGIVTNVVDLFSIIPQGNEFMAGYWVVVLVVISKVTNMYFGVSSEILMYSRYRKLMLNILIITSILVIISNLVFIPTLGLLGAGIAYFLPMFISQIVRVFWIRKLFNFPFFVLSHWKTIIPILASLFFALLFNPEMTIAIKIVVRSMLTTAIFLALALPLKISPELNMTLKKAFDIILPVRKQ